MQWRDPVDGERTVECHVHFPGDDVDMVRAAVVFLDRGHVTDIREEGEARLCCIEHVRAGLNSPFVTVDGADMAFPMSRLRSGPHANHPLDYHHIDVAALNHALGLPVVVWHASRERRDRFRPMSHFGTFEAAVQRARDTGATCLHRVGLRVSRALTITDSGTGSHTPRGILTELESSARHPDGHDREGEALIGFDETDRLLSTGDARSIARFLARRLDIDCLTYINAHEDRNSLSWIVLDPSRAVVLDARPIVADLNVLWRQFEDAAGMVASTPERNGSGAPGP